MKEAERLGVKTKPEWRGTTQLNKTWSEEFSRKAKEKGYDAVVAYTDDKFNDIVEAAIFDASKIKPEK